MSQINYKLNHLYYNYLDDRLLYYVSNWSDEILVEIFKRCDEKYYTFVYEDDGLFDLDTFNSMIPNGHIRDLGLLSETDYSFQEVYNVIDNRHFGNNTNMVLVRNREKELNNELKSIDYIVDVNTFKVLAKKYHELFE